MIKIIKYHNNYILKFIILFNLIFIGIFLIFFLINKKEKENTFKNLLNSKDYKNNKFIIIQHNCNTCGLFSFYKVSVGWIIINIINIYFN